MRKCIFIILLAAFVYNCSNPQSVALYQISGTVSEAINNQLFPKEGVVVSVSSLFDTTDTNGKFLFPNLDPGEYRILINDSGYFKIDTTVNIVNKGVNVDLLISRKIDYFPLNLGNNWTFLYIYNYRTVHFHVGAFPIKQFEGIKNWNVISTISTDTSITYEILENFDGYKLKLIVNPDSAQPYPPLKYDTLEYFHDYKVFYIEETNNNQLVFEQSSNILKRIRLNRYYTCTKADTIRIYTQNVSFDEYESVQLIKDTGIYYYFRMIPGSSVHHRWYEEYFLKEYINTGGD